jgi:hypothetical protein
MQWLDIREPLQGQKHQPVRNTRQCAQFVLTDATWASRPVDIDNLSIMHQRTGQSAHLGVDDSFPSAWRLSLIPASLVNPLPEYLKRWLRKVFLTLWHIEVIHKDNEPLPSWRPKDALSTLVHLCVDDVLSLACAGARREGHEDVGKLCRHGVHQHVLHTGDVRSAPRLPIHDYRATAICRELKIF